MLELAAACGGLRSAAAAPAGAVDGPAPPPSPPKTLAGIVVAVRAVAPIIVGFLVTRLVVVPAAVFAVFRLLQRVQPRSAEDALDDAWLGAPLAQLLLLVSSGMPSAVVLVVFLNKFGQVRARVPREWAAMRADKKRGATCDPSWLSGDCLPI